MLSPETSFVSQTPNKSRTHSRKRTSLIGAAAMAVTAALTACGGGSTVDHDNGYGSFPTATSFEPSLGSHDENPKKDDSYTHCDNSSSDTITGGFPDISMVTIEANAIPAFLSHSGDVAVCLQALITEEALSATKVSTNVCFASPTTAAQAKQEADQITRAIATANLLVADTSNDYAHNNCTPDAASIYLEPLFQDADNK